MATYTSLEAFVAYGQLYEMWWNPPPKDALDWEQQGLAPEACSHEQTALDHSTTEKVCSLEETALEAESFSREHGNGLDSETDLAITPGLLTERQGKLRDCRVLLSEEHAAIQSTQRDIARVQQTLADMISQHQKNNLQESIADKQESAEGDTEKPLSPPSQSQNKQVKEPVSLPHLMKQLTEANQHLAEFPDSIKGHRLVFCLNELLYKCLNERNPVETRSPSSPCYHSWAVKQDSSFIEMVTDVWQSIFAVNAAEQAQDLYEQLRIIEYPPSTSNTHPRQLLFHISHDLTVALLRHQTDSWEETVKATLGAVTRSYEAGNFTLMQEICNLLFPRGCDHLRDKLGSTNSQTMATYTSLVAFVAYGQLYELWWNPPPKDALDWEQQGLAPEACSHEQTALDHSTTEKVCSLEETALEAESFSREHGNGLDSETDLAITPGLLTERQGKLRDCRVLLSEEHAAIQSTQRDIARVQQTLADMISQHQKNNLQESIADKQESAEGDTEKPLSPPSQSQNKQVKEPVSLLHLMKQHTEANQHLAEFPDSIKASPFPDVLERCLVVLHMGVRCHVDLTSELQKQSLHLLRKYGHLCIHKEACRKFLHEPPAS